MAWLALSWKVFGQAPLVTRCAMLLLAAFSLLGFFRLARTVANSTVAILSTLLVGIYPVFFAQSSLAQVDLPSAGFVFWGLGTFFRNRKLATEGRQPPVPWSAVAWFSLAALAKETAILVPLAVIAAQVISAASTQFRARYHSEAAAHSGARNLQLQAKPKSQENIPPSSSCDSEPALASVESASSVKERLSLSLALPVIPLAVWYAYHYSRTGHVFGNPEFFRYNVQSTLHPLRIFLALILRIWQLTGYLGLYLLTASCLIAMAFPPIHDHNGERPRIDLSIQYSFLAITLVYLIGLSVIGGAVLARYMLPVVPLVILISVSTIWRRLRLCNIIIAIIALAFISSLFINPPYGFAPEDNLAYRDYIRLHQRAEAFLEQRYPSARVLTAWPASDEITHPYLGYVSKPMRVVRIENFSVQQMLAADNASSSYDVALVFSTKYQSHYHRWRFWQKWDTRYFDFHVDLSPEAAASVLGGRLVYVERRRGQWVGLISIERVEEARFASGLAPNNAASGR